jgi:hypothetical protein
MRITIVAARQVAAETAQKSIAVLLSISGLTKNTQTTVTNVVRPSGVSFLGSFYSGVI